MKGSIFLLAVGLLLPLGTPGGAIADEDLPEGAVTRFGSTHLRIARSADSLAFSPDGKLLACAGFDGSIYVWEAATGRLLHRSVTDKHPEVIFSSDGKSLVSVTRKRAVAWSVPRFNPIETMGEQLSQHDLAAEIALARGRSIYAIVERKDETFKNRGMNTMVVRDARGHDELMKVPYHGYSVYGDITPDNRFVVFPFRKGPDGKVVDRKQWKYSVQVWNVNDKKLQFEVPWQNVSFGQFAITSDGKRLFATDGNGGLRQWNLTTGNEGARLVEKGKKVGFIALSNDDRRLVIGHVDGLRIIDLAADKVLAEIDAATGATCGALSHDGQSVAVGGLGGTVHIFDAQSGKELLPHTGLESPIHSIAISRDSRFVMTHPGQVWDLRSKKMVHGGDRSMNAYNITSGPGTREFVFSFGFDHRVVSHGDSQWQETPAVFSVPRKGCFAFSADGKEYALGHEGIEIFGWGDKKPRVTIAKEATGEVNSLAFSGDAARIASCGQMRGVRVWDTKSGELVRIVDTGRRMQSKKLAFIGEDQFLIAFDGTGIGHDVKQKTLTAWRLGNGKKYGTFPLPFGTTSFDLSVDGKSLVTGNYDGTFVLWSLEDMLIETEQ